jgi:hypothetical protein
VNYPRGPQTETPPRSQTNRRDRRLSFESNFAPDGTDPLSGRTGFVVFQAKDLPDLICAVHNNCEAENTFLGGLCMLAFNRLRVDPGNGSPVVDYRIENGVVESRTLERDAAKTSTLAIEKQWRRLTPEQLTSRLMADKVLLRWLRHRMGVHRLIRACNQESSSPNNPAWKAPTEPQPEHRYLAKT